MGIRDLFETTQNCPACGTPWARRTLFGRIRCPSPLCRHFDRALAGASGSRSFATAAPEARPAPGRAPERRRGGGSFRLGADRLVVRYRNFRGDEKTFEGDPRSLRFKGAHVSLRVAPTGRRITLRLESIGNREDVERLRSTIPSPDERKILTYHSLRGTTSPRYEEVRRKYPDWAS